MIFAYEQDVTEYFSKGSNGAGRKELVSQFTCLQPHFYVEYK